MSHSTCRRGRPWRNGLALVLACASLLALAATAHGASARFCPAGGGTITLGAASGCTNSTYTLLTAVIYYNAAAPWHCAVGKATDDPGGSSSNVFPASCGYGATGNGAVTAGGGAGGTWGYARGKNDDSFTYSGFYGDRVW
jgi:hypothetical protein